MKGRKERFARARSTKKKKKKPPNTKQQKNNKQKGRQELEEGVAEVRRNGVLENVQPRLPVTLFRGRYLYKIQKGGGGGGKANPWGKLCRPKNQGKAEFAGPDVYRLILLKLEGKGGTKMKGGKGGGVPGRIYPFGNHEKIKECLRIITRGVHQGGRTWKGSKGGTLTMKDMLTCHVKRYQMKPLDSHPKITYHPEKTPGGGNGKRG